MESTFLVPMGAGQCQCRPGVVVLVTCPKVAEHSLLARVDLVDAGGQPENESDPQDDEGYYRDDPVAVPGPSSAPSKTASKPFEKVR